MKIEDEKLYDLKQLAEILQVSRQTLYNNIQKETLPVKKFGRKYMITGKNIKYLMENGFPTEKQ